MCLLRTRDCALNTVNEHLKRRGWEGPGQEKNFHHCGWAPCASLEEGLRKDSESKRAAGDRALSSCTQAAVPLEQWGALCPSLVFQRPLTQGQDKAGPFVKVSITAQPCSVAETLAQRKQAGE